MFYVKKNFILCHNIFWLEFFLNIEKAKKTSWDLQTRITYLVWKIEKKSDIFCYSCLLFYLFFISYL